MECGSGSNARTVSRSTGPSSPASNFSALVRKDVDELGFVTAAGALGDHLLHGRKSVVDVERDGVLRHRHHADRKFHRVARETPRQSLSIPALIDLA
jgi:hypothetical protein